MTWWSLRSSEVWLGVVCAALACGPSDPGPSPEPPQAAAVAEPAPAVEPALPRRVVLVSIDTLRADRVHCYGAERAHTPNLDAVAAKGVRFETAIAPTPTTLPSHASLMTGLEPPAHGVRHNGVFRLDGEVPVLAERMRAHGLATAAFVGAFVLDDRFGLGRGFDVYDDDLGQGLVAAAEFGTPERRARHVIDAAVAWLRSAPDGFFLWVHLYDPHADHVAPRRYVRLAGGDPYGGEIAYADAQMGRLLSTVAERWPDGASLVAITSDHGEALGEHGEATHSYGVYDATQRIPLLLAGPGVPRGVVVAQPVRLIDLAPTLLALVGAEPLPGVQGRDLRPLWEGGEREGRAAYVETLATQLDLGWSPLVGVRTDRYKYIRAPRPELYDLREDPGETRNLYDPAVGAPAELEGLLEQSLAAPRDATWAGALDPAARARLESLGYVVPEVDPSTLALGRVGGIDPKDRVAALRIMDRASELIQAGRPREALERMEPLGGEGRRIALYRAKANLMLADAQATKEAARELIDSGDSILGHMFLGLALELEGALDEARAAFERVLELDPQRADARVGLARLAELEGDREGAAAHLEAALERERLDPEAYWRLAAIRLEQGRSQEARSLIARVAPDALRTPAAARRLAVAEQRVGLGAEAIARLEGAAEAHPQASDLLLALASALEAAGRPADALARREAAYRADPESPAVQNDLAWSLASRGRDLDRALALARSAAARAPRSPDVLDTLATVHAVRREWEEALRIAERALALPDAPREHLLEIRGAALAQLGRADEARAPEPPSPQ